jgi:hypothetical protein
MAHGDEAPALLPRLDDEHGGRKAAQDRFSWEAEALGRRV